MYKEVADHMRQAILFLTNHSDSVVVEGIRQLMQTASACQDVYILFNLDDEEHLIPKELLATGASVYTFSSSILYEMGYRPLGDSLVYGNCHFPALKFYKSHPSYDYYWIIEDDVHYTGNWSTFFNKVANDKSDLLSTYVRSWKDEPSWGWWATLETGNIQLPVEKQIASFNPVYRLSNQAMSAIDKLLTSGWQGHNETIIPTIVIYPLVT